MPEANVRLPLIVLCLVLGGCSTDLTSFSVADLNPLKGNDPLRRADYNYFYKRDSVSVGPVTAADLIGPDGRCAYDAAPAAPAAAAVAPGVAAAPQAVPEPAPNQPINPRSNQALYFTAGPETGRVASAPPGALPPEVRGGPRGISLAMTECQVVAVAGYTDRIEIGANQRGERTVKLTYVGGDRPGVYIFRGGRLVEMERVEAPPQAKKQPQRATKTAKSKPAQ